MLVTRHNRIAPMMVCRHIIDYAASEVKLVMRHVLN